MKTIEIHCRLSEDGCWKFKKKIKRCDLNHEEVEVNEKNQRFLFKMNLEKS
jgi:hypothetical protein